MQFKLTPVLIAAVIATGCAPGETSMKPLGSLDNTETQGLVFDGDDSAQAGMSGPTCQIDPDTGDIGQDVDVAESEDQVIDACDGLVLVQGEDGLHVYDPSVDGIGDTGFLGEDPGYTPPDVPGDDILTGRLMNDGSVVVVRQAEGGARVAFPSGDVVRLSGALGEVDLDPEGGTLFASVGGSVWAVTPDGATALADGDLLSWDAGSGTVLIGSMGKADITSVSPTGVVASRVETGTYVYDIEALGDRGEVVAVIAGFRGGAEMRRYATDTGVLLDQRRTRSASNRLVVSESGRSLAVVQGRSAQFFRVE